MYTPKWCGWCKWYKIIFIILIITYIWEYDPLHFKIPSFICFIVWILFLKSNSIHTIISFKILNDVIFDLNYEMHQMNWFWNEEYHIPYFWDRTRVSTCVLTGVICFQFWLVYTFFYLKLYINILFFCCLVNEISLSVWKKKGGDNKL